MAVFRRVKHLTQIPHEDRSCAICLQSYTEPNPDEALAKSLCGALPMRDWDTASSSYLRQCMQASGFGKEHQTHPVRLVGCRHHFCAPCAKQHFFGSTDNITVACPMCRRPYTFGSEIAKLRTQLRTTSVRQMCKGGGAEFGTDAFVYLGAIDARRIKHHLVNIFAIAFTRTGVVLPKSNSSRDGRGLAALFRAAADPEALHSMQTRERLSEKVSENIEAIEECGFRPLERVYHIILQWQLEQPFVYPEDLFQGISQDWVYGLAKDCDWKMGAAMGIVFRYFVRWAQLAGRISYLRKVRKLT